MSLGARFRAAPLALAGMIAASGAAAHAIGERYELPVPLAYYVGGAAAVVALTFAAMAALPQRSLPWRGAAQAGAGSVTVPAWAIGFARLVAVLLLALIAAAGLCGDPHPARNIAPTLVWIVWWIGFSMLAALAGDAWPAINPWRALFDGAARVVPRRQPVRPYPRALAAWPAVLQLLLLAWIEVVSPVASNPMAIAWLALAYSAWTWAGMTVFGTRPWLAHADAFALAFATLGRLAPLSLVEPAEDRSDAGWRVELRWPGAGLLDSAGLGAAGVAFVMAMLSTVLFDGFLGTSAWRAFDRWVTALLPRGFDREGYIAATLGLIGLWLGFLAAYWATARIMAAAAGPGTCSAAPASSPRSAWSTRPSPGPWRLPPSSSAT